MKWLIIFPDSWIAYSPSCINFAKMLERNGEQYFVLRHSDYEVVNEGIDLKQKIITFNKILFRIFNKRGIRIFLKYYKILNFYKEAKKLEKEFHFDRFVGIDEVGYVTAYLLNKKAIYYSLEVSNSLLDNFIFKCLKPYLLIIQSKERKDYLCKKNMNVAYIQNSPIVENKIAQKKYSGKLIYFGNLELGYGLGDIFDSLYSMNEVLYVKYLKKTSSKYRDSVLNKYKKLIDEKQLILDDSYIEQEAVIDYIRDFDIGFCFYDKQQIEKSFNLASSPSGKMFNYFATGIPVIANDTVGFNPIKQFNAGILLKDINTQTIIEAIGKIRENYSVFRENSINAGVEFNYAKMFNENKEKIFL